MSLLRLLKRILENRKSTNRIIQKIKKESIIKKLIKFSDCTNFLYERELLSLIRKLMNSQEDQ